LLSAAVEWSEMLIRAVYEASVTHRLIIIIASI